MGQAIIFVIVFLCGLLAGIVLCCSAVIGRDREGKGERRE